MLELDGEPAGYALYRIRLEVRGRRGGRPRRRDRGDRGRAPGHARALAVLLDMDWKATLKAYLLPIDHPVHQLVYPRRMQLRVGDGLWVRLVDVGAALRAGLRRRRRRRARARGRLPAGERGRWRIADGAAAQADDADLALGVGELGAVYLGEFGFGELVRAGVVSELKEEERPARTLFRTDAEAVVP